MILKKYALLSIFCLLIFAGASRAQDARKIREGVYKQDTSRDTTWRGKLDAVDKNGTVRSKRFTVRKLGRLGNSKTLVRFTDPPEVRGVGLLWGIEIVRDGESRAEAPELAAAVTVEAMERGLIVGGLRPGIREANVLRLGPPLVIGDQEIARAVTILEEALTSVQSRVRLPADP